MGNCLRSVISVFDALQDLWVAMKNYTNSELKLRVLGENFHIKTFSYMFGIHLAETILAHMQNLNKTIQSTPMNEQVLVHATVKTSVDTIREEIVTLFWAKQRFFH